ncbi:MAG TPA: cell division protein ZapA [Desulfuromonadales bacterium]|nr:cell division protein ZapA [Desulfuromonadales bacterium]
MKANYAVTILGRELSVKSSAPAEQVQAVEAFVNEKLLRLGSALRSGDAQLVLTLALLNTAEELLELRTAVAQDETLDGRIAGIIKRLETASN